MQSFGPVASGDRAVVSRPTRVGLYGMYGSANLGDVAIQRVVMRELLARRPDLEFVAICPDPADAARSFGVPGFSISGTAAPVQPLAADESSQAAAESGGVRLPLPESLRSSLRIYRQAGSIDLLIVSGGGQIDDFWGGPWHQPFNLWRWCLAARVRGCPIAAFAVGMDRLDSFISRRFVISALGMANCLSFRDGGTIEMLQALGLSADLGLCPDPAFLYTEGRPLPAENPGSGPWVAISPISKAAFPEDDPRVYDSYLKSVADLADWLIGRGVRVLFVYSQVSMDAGVVPAIASRMNETSGYSTASIGSVDEFCDAVDGAELVVASRLHSLILALGLGIPSIAVSPVRKVTRQMIDLDLADYCVDLQTLDSFILCRKVERALEGRVLLASHIRSRVAMLRTNLHKVFDELAALTATRRK